MKDLLAKLKRKQKEFVMEQHETINNVVLKAALITLFVLLVAMAGCTSMALPDGRVFATKGFGSNMTYERSTKVEYYDDGSTASYEMVEHVSREETASKVIHAGQGLVGTMVDGYSKLKP